MKWLPRTKYAELVDKLRSKSPQEIDNICDRLAGGETYSGYNVYLGELRPKLRQAGLLVSDSEDLDRSNDIEL